jgi:outer membrane protein OmpA-like peptidoglycan-associated protein
VSRSSPRLAAVASLMLASLVLGGCVSQVEPKISQAVLDSRARAAAAHAQPADQCLAATPPPKTVLFPFQGTEPDASARVQLDGVARSLRCDPALRIALAAEADQHGTAAEQRALIAGRIAFMRQYLVAAGAGATQLATAPATAGLTLTAQGRAW